MMRMCQYIAALESRVGELEKLIKDEVLDAREHMIDVLDFEHDTSPVISDAPRRRGRKPKVETTNGRAFDADQAQKINISE